MKQPQLSPLYPAQSLCQAKHPRLPPLPQTLGTGARTRPKPWEVSILAAEHSGSPRKPHTQSEAAPHPQTPFFQEILSDFSLPRILGVVALGTSLSMAGAGKRVWLDSQAELGSNSASAALRSSSLQPFVATLLTLVESGGESHHVKLSLERTWHLLMISCPTSPLDPRRVSPDPQL